MTFTIDKVPGGDVAAWGIECRDQAVAGVAQGLPARCSRLDKVVDRLRWRSTAP